MSIEFLAALTSIKRAEKRLSEVREDLEILSERKIEYTVRISTLSNIISDMGCGYD